MINRKKILLIEDDNVLSSIITAYFKKSSYELCNVFTKGEEAVDYIQAHNPVDLVLCDINLQGELSGYQTSQQIQSFIHLPFIFISSDVYPEVLKTEPYGYLLKPFSNDQLCIAIKIAFSRAAIERKLNSYQAHLQQAQQLGNMGSWEWNIISSEITWTDQIYRIFGLTPQQFVPTYPNFLERIHPDDQQSVIDAVNNAVEHHNAYDIEHRIVTPDGDIRFVHEIGEVYYNSEAQPVRMIGTVLDISKNKALEVKLSKLAYHDSLTSLPNRSLLISHLQKQLARSKRDGDKFAVLFIDLDNFKPINDTYGHEVGDNVLQEVARRLQNSTREMDTVARMGGDEFVVLLTSIKAIKDIHNSAQKIINLLEETIEVGAINTSISASIGFAVYPDHAHSINELLSKSDNAMYQAKKNSLLKIFNASDLPS